jgi:site-specific DNA recombinase
VRKATASVEPQLERLTDAYLHAILSRAEYQRRRQELARQLQILATQAQQLEALVDRRAATAGLATSLADFCQRLQAGLATATFVQKRTLVELLVDRVLVANGEVEIRYVLPTHPRSEKIRFCHLRKDYFHDIIEILGVADNDGRLVSLVVALDRCRVCATLIDRDLLGPLLVTNGLA